MVVSPCSASEHLQGTAHLQHRSHSAGDTLPLEVQCGECLRCDKGVD